MIYPSIHILKPLSQELGTQGSGTPLSGYKYMTEHNHTYTQAPFRHYEELRDGNQPTIHLHWKPKYNRDNCLPLKLYNIPVQIKCPRYDQIYSGFDNRRSLWLHYAKCVDENKIWAR